MHTFFLVATVAFGLLMLGGGALNVWVITKGMKDRLIRDDDLNLGERMAAGGMMIGGAVMLAGVVLAPWLAVGGGVVAGLAYVSFSGLQNADHERVVGNIRADEARRGASPMKMSTPSTGWLIAILTIASAVGFVLTQ